MNTKSKKHYLVDVDYLGDLDRERCKNCGEVVSDIVIVKDKDNIVYRICLDCMMKLNISTDEQEEAKGKLASLGVFVNFIKNKCKTVAIDGNMCFLYAKDKRYWGVDFVYKCNASFFYKMLKKIKTNGIKFIYGK